MKTGIIGTPRYNENIVESGHFGGYKVNYKAPGYYSVHEPLGDADSAVGAYTLEVLVETGAGVLTFARDIICLVHKK